MKTEKNIFIAFILNFAFSIFEFVGGIVTGSVAILSDAVHDLGDAASIGVSFFLERKSKCQPDNEHSYGYGRYSVVGGAITILILLIGSCLAIYNAVFRILKPVEINYNGMILLAIIGVVVNLIAAFITHEKTSLNQKAVNLHMIEDVLGWIVVLIGAIAMKFTNWTLLDPILSIVVASFILFNAIKAMREIMIVLLEKTPSDIDLNELKKHILSIDGIIDVHHIHVWSVDGHNNYATMHIVTNLDSVRVKKLVREELVEHNISHSTLELEGEGEVCSSKCCHVSQSQTSLHHHCHSHHHH